GCRAVVRRNGLLAGELVALFEEQPLVLFASLELDEGKLAVQFLTVEDEAQAASAQTIGDRDFGIYPVCDGAWLVSPLVPDHDVARAIVPLRDDSFKGAVLPGMVFDLDCQPLVGRVERRPLGDGPTLHDAAQLQAQIVM